MIAPTGLKYTSIKQNRGFVTALDNYDLSQDFAYRVRGFLNTVQGFVAKSDTGTQQRFADLPYLPNLAKAITAVVASGTLIKITVAGHGRATGDIIMIAGVTGTGAALVNGIWTVTKVDNDKLTLDGSTFNGALAYANGTIALPISLRRGASFYDKDRAKECNLVAGVDATGKTRLYAHDGTSWTELTRVLTTTLNGTPAAAADNVTPVVCQINACFDQGPNAATILPDNLIGYIALNTTRNTYSIVIDNAGTQITVPHDVSNVPWGWLTTDAISFYRSTVILDGYNFANGDSPHVRFLSSDAQKKVTVLYADNSGSALVRKSPLTAKYQPAARSLFTVVVGAVAATGSADVSGAVVGDHVIINGRVLVHAGAGLWNSAEDPTTYGYGAQGLATLINVHGYLSTIVVATYVANDVTITALTPGVAGNAITLAVGGAGTIVSGPNLTGGTDGTSTPSLNLALGFYMEKAYPTVKSATLGTIDAPKKGTDDALTVEIGDGLSVTATFSEVPNLSAFTHVRAYIIPIYRGYQFGDPIFKLFLSGSTRAKFPKATLKLNVDPAIVNKDITGFRLFVANETNAKPTQSDWLDDASEYVLTSEKSMLAGTDNWSYDNSIQNCYNISFLTGNEGAYDTVLSSGEDSIEDVLNRVPTMDRTELKPLYVVQSTRNQASIIVVDQDETVLRISNYNGDGTHEDDVFAPAALDVSGKKLKLLLTSRGDILGLDIGNGLITALKQTAIEMNNLDTGEQKVMAADVYSKDSIIRHDYGLSWTGISNAYLIPNGSFEIIPLLADIKNFFDGSLLIDDKSVAYVTDAYRQAVISGWDPIYKSVWWHVKVNKDKSAGLGTEYLCVRMTMEKSTLATNFSVRQLNVGSDKQTVRWLNVSSDGFMVIGYATGILKYPVLTGLTRFQDDVRSDGVSASRGIPRSILIHLGSLSSLVAEKSAYAIILGFQGESVDGMGMVTVNIYADELTLIDTMYVRIDAKPEPMYIESIGKMKRMWIEVLLPSTLTNFRTTDLSEIAVGFVPSPL